MDTVLEVDGLARRYGAQEALRGVSLALRAGECLGLLGPNGAGKTTLVRAIAGRVQPDAGAITLLGKALQPGAREGRESLGVVPQEIALYADLTGQENLEIFGALQGVPRAALDERVDWAMAFSGLEARRHDRVGAYSGGMKRRLNIACSTLHRPRVLLLDEPTVGVDPQSRERIWRMLAELQADGASLVLTTHQLDEAETQCDRIVIIDHGRVIAQGTLQELAQRVDLEAAAPPPGPRVAPPSLQAVFIHLTGRELRE